MNPAGPADSDPNESSPLEGRFDAQLSFALPAFGQPPAPASVIKRDGSVVPFELRKVSRTILEASQSVGQDDVGRAWDLAKAIGLFLKRKSREAVPDVERVRQAVEKVLSEMGQAQVASAYSRFADKRNKMRALNEGLDETDAENATRRRVASDAWNRERSVAELTALAGLDVAQATLVGSEVDGWIASIPDAKITAGLVRELTYSALAKQGFKEACRRYENLSFPLKDIERTIVTPSELDPARHFDPADTDGLLAERVKADFALARVFSARVKEHHCRGDIHIGRLGAIDRLDSVTQSLEGLKRWGLLDKAGEKPGVPARTAGEVTAQVACVTASLTRHFAGWIRWDAVNYCLAPYLKELDDPALASVARTMMHELASRDFSRGEPGPPVSIGLWWAPPDFLADEEVIGPGGKFLGGAYREHAHHAQRFAWALIEAYRQLDERGEYLPAPALVIHLSRDFFGAPGHESFLAHSAQLATGAARIQFRFHRGSPILPHTVDAFVPLNVAAQNVTLNLARAAHRSMGQSGMSRDLEQQMQAAVSAHLQRKTFLNSLLARRGGGPLGLLSKSRGTQDAPLQLDRCLFPIAVTGLNDCVQALSGKPLHDSEEGCTLAETLLSSLRDSCAEWSENTGLHVVLASDETGESCHYFAEKDLAQFGAAVLQATRVGEAFDGVSYAPGTSLNAPGGLSLMDRVRLESRFHPYLGYGALTRLPRPEPETSAKSIAHLIQSAFTQTSCSSLAFGL